MPLVEISEETSQKLQMFATPLKDSYETVIRRLVEAARQGVPYPMPATMIAPVITPVIEDAALPDNYLTHTKVLNAQFAGVALPKANWNSLMQHAHRVAFQKMGSFDALRDATRAHVKQGRYEEEGFAYLGKNSDGSNVDVSLQGMDANLSWASTVHLAKAIGVPVEVNFEWRDNPKAAKPRQRGHLGFVP